MKSLHLIFASVVTGVLVSTQAWSVSLTTTGDYAISGTTVAANPQLAGLVLEDTISNFSISGAGESLLGTIQNRVVRSSVDGTLDFYWRITPTSGEGDISAFRVLGFDGYTLNADWRVDGLGSVAPTTARYFGPGSGAINFLFDGGEVGVGQSSYFFFLDTNATSYSKTGQFDLLCANSGCISQLYETYAPSVPIPQSAWLLGSGLMGVVSLRRRQQATNA